MTLSVDSRPTELSMTVLMTPDMANFAGNVHGGALLRLLDQVAYTCASKYAQSYVVTLSVDRVLFREVVHVGELVTFDASINYVGRTSMEVGIRVTAEDIHTGAVRHANSSYFTMIAVDADGQPEAVPPLNLTSPTAQRRFEEARMRRRALRDTFAHLDAPTPSPSVS